MGVAGWQQDLPEEAMLGLRTEASGGVEQLQAKGAACAIVLHREEAKSISRAGTSR